MLVIGNGMGFWKNDMDCTNVGYDRFYFLYVRLGDVVASENTTPSNTRLGHHIAIRDRWLGDLFFHTAMDRYMEWLGLGDIDFGRQSRMDPSSMYATTFFRGCMAWFGNCRLG